MCTTSTRPTTRSQTTTTPSSQGSGILYVVAESVMGLWVWVLVVARGLIDTPSWILYSNLSDLAWSLHTHVCVCLRACECAAMNNIMPDVWCNRCLAISDNQSVSPRKTSYVGEIDTFLYLTTNLYRPAQRRRRYPRVPCLEQRPDGQGRRGDGRRRWPGAPASGSLTCICTVFCRGLPGGSLLHVTSSSSMLVYFG